MNTNAILGAHPVNLLKALNEMFKDEDWYSWEPEVLLHELRDEVSEQAQDKILAVQAVACNSSLACSKAVAFENVVHAFCNNILVVDTLQPPLIEEIMYTVEQLRGLVRAVHPEVTDVPLHGELPGYVAAVAKYRGWIVLPERLTFAQEALDRLNGMEVETNKHEEFKATLGLIKGLVAAVGQTTVAASDEIYQMLEDDSQKTAMIRLILGAYLYDPTLPFSK